MKGGVIFPIIKTQFTLRLNLGVHAKNKKLAYKESRSITNMIEYLIKKEIERYEKENGELVLSEDDLFIK